MDPWHGGVVRTCELRSAGLSRRDIERAVRSGDLIRVRPGWFARRGLDDDRMAAARAGGRLTCLSAARAYGLWIPPGVDERPHIALHDASHRAPSRHRCHRDPREPVLSRCRDRTLVDPVAMLEQLIRCQDAETAFVVIESALATPLVSREEWVRLLRRLSPRLAHPLSLASDLSGSGTESRFVFRIRRCGIRVRQQVWIGQDRTDVELDDGTIVELDSSAHHDALLDARRDARVGIRGRPTLRFRYEQVWFEWDSVEAAVLAARRRGRPGHPGP